MNLRTKWGKVHKERTLFQIVSFDNNNNETFNVFFLKQNIYTKSLKNICDEVHICNAACF